MAIEIITYGMLEGSGKVWVDEQEARIRRETTKWLALVLIGLVSPIALSFLRMETQDPALWFQRSGSIMVVLALLAELRVVIIDRLIIARDHSFLYCHMYIENKYQAKLRVINYVTYFVVAVGTLVWGFGDVFYANIVLAK
ncbi:hypothetical protein [Vreelandella neptunia]|uniref:Uncharacterized protein n=1 Tax=Vreelandella neptunia TaxID=115551 RepID=A0ABS9SBD2_9GAMM|nr:hypothetical protein [Halomonas neptunia]MCH4813428.1 hypothetical protein [Halomonas neptunia]